MTIKMTGDVLGQNIRLLKENIGIQMCLNLPCLILVASLIGSTVIGWMDGRMDG